MRCRRRRSATSSSQTKNSRPTTAGQTRTAARQLRDGPAADADGRGAPRRGCRGSSRTGRSTPRPGRAARTASRRRPSRRPTGTASRPRPSEIPPAMPWATIQAQPTSPIARGARSRSAAGTWTTRPGVDRRGAHVAREHEHERQRDGRRGAGEVDGERQRALVDGDRPCAAATAGSAERDRGDADARRARGGRARGDVPRARRTPGSALIVGRGCGGGRRPPTPATRASADDDREQDVARRTRPATSARQTARASARTALADGSGRWGSADGTPSSAG